jgi:anti-sigma factor RsiW
MKICEEYELLASAFVDDELSREETMSLLDHLATCDSCRLFYREARSLQEAVISLPDPAVLPKAAWQRIESRARSNRPVVPAPVWRIAAGFFLAILVWQVAQVRVAPLSDPQLVQVSLEESRGSMSDARFVELTAEVLRADRRYHQAMLEVMREVNQVTGIERVSEESVLSEGESGDEGGRGEEES